MTDRLYCREGSQFALYNFEMRTVRFTEEHPHPNGSNMFPPFYVDAVTFWAIVGRIEELDALNSVRTRKKNEELP